MEAWLFLLAIVLDIALLFTMVFYVIQAGALDYIS
jgi:hypothetical protein